MYIIDREKVNEKIIFFFLYIRIKKKQKSETQNNQRIKIRDFGDCFEVKKYTSFCIFSLSLSLSFYYFSLTLYNIVLKRYIILLSVFFFYLNQKSFEV